MPDKTRETLAYVVALLVFVGVGVGAFCAVSSDEEISPPSTSTTVIKETDGVPATKITTTTTTRAGKEPAERVKTVESTGPKPDAPTETTTTETEGERNFLERTLGTGGVSLLQLGAALLAAFLAAAITQRAIVGQFGGLEIGAFKLPALAKASTEGIEKLRDETQKLNAATAKEAADELAKLTAAVTEARQAQADGDKALANHLAVIYERVNLIEKRLEELQSRVSEENE